MEDREYKRLRRLVLRCFFISLFLIVLAVFLGSYKLKSLNTQFANQKTQIVRQTIIQRYQPLPPIDGKDGTNGTDGKSIQGPKGDMGDNGVNVTPEQIAQAVSAYFETNPPVGGATGAQGAPGRTVLIRLDPLTGLEECQYLGDLAWQPITECQ